MIEPADGVRLGVFRVETRRLMELVAELAEIERSGGRPAVVPAPQPGRFTPPSAERARRR